MSDDILGDFLPEEGESALEAKARQAGPAADPIATGLVLGAATHHPHFIEEAIAYLRDARLLLAEQIATLRVEDPIIPVAVGEARLRRLSLRLKITFFTAAALALLVVVAAMIWSAARSHNVVVEAFEAPPSFVSRGLTGRALAAGLLDELRRLRDATRSSYTPLEAQSAWAADIRIIVPETGIAIGDIDRVLHARLGHDLHIGGEVMEPAPGRAALRVRGDGVRAKTFEGPAGDIGKLTVQAAEWVYGESQPHEYAAYLTDTGRDQEALDFLPGAFSRAGDDEQRAALANTWGVAYNDLNKTPEAIVKYRAAMALKPRYWRAWSNLLSVMPISDGEEATWEEAHSFDLAAQDAPAYDKPPLRLMAPFAVATRDKMLSIRSQLADMRVTPGGTSTVSAAPSLGASYAEVHDWPDAHRYVELALPDDPMKKAALQQIEAGEAIDRNDFSGAIAPLEGLHRDRQASPLMQSYIYDDCSLGYAYGMAGRLDDAEAVFAANGKWSECLAWRGAVLAHAGRIDDAQKVWAEAIKTMPHLPETYVQRGIWRAAHGDGAGALADFSVAHDGAPHFAEPLKAWGDALASAGRRREAAAKYDEALADAPAWPELKAARAALRQAAP